MENRDFYDTTLEYLEAKKKDPIYEYEKNLFIELARRCDIPQDCFDEYNGSYDYTRVFLSYYYHAVLYAYELDFQGKPLGDGYSDENLLLLNKIMQKRESVSKYIENDMSFEYYHRLKEKYKLVF